MHVPPDTKEDTTIVKRPLITLALGLCGAVGVAATALAGSTSPAPRRSYVWAHGLAEQIHGSVLLTRVGDGHISYYTYPCACAAIDGYLVAGTAAHPDRQDPRV